MNRVVELLINCYYDKMTVVQAVEFVKRFGVTPSQKKIDQAKEIIKKCTYQDWK